MYFIKTSSSKCLHKSNCFVGFLNIALKINEFGIKFKLFA